MKRTINFDVDGIDSLANLIRKGLKGYASNTEQLGGMTTLWCFLCDDAVLKIHSVMTDIGGWDEVGTLVFRLATKDDNLPEMIPLPPTWGCVASVEKLELDEDDFSAESGLVIQTCDGEELIVVCGTNVYTIQMTAPFFSCKFQPEYEINRYKRMSL